MPSASPSSAARTPAPTAAVALATIAAVVLGAAPVADAQFVDRTVAAGMLWKQVTWGAALQDLDLDGDLDVYVGHHFYAPRIYWNTGGGAFDSDLHPAPWAGAIDRHGPLAVSVDSDADPEIYIAHGGQGGGGTEPSELYRNDGGGSLISLLGAGGLADPAGRGRAASAADYNGDGRLDLWVGKAPGASPNSLYRNDLDFWFHDVAGLVGLAETEGTVGGLWGDVDDDGDPDLLVGGEEFPRPTRLWRNDGSAFADASAGFSPPLPEISGADWGDFDNDGDLDLAVCDGQIGLFDFVAEGDTVGFYVNARYGENGVDGITVPSVGDTAWAFFRVRGQVDTALVFLGPAATNPLPGWVPLTDALVGAPAFAPGVDRGIFVWRASPGGAWEVRCSTPLANFDAFDGRIVQGSPVAGIVTHDFESANFVSGRPRVWRNDGGGAFVEITDALGLPPFLVNPRDVSWTDHDNDGDLDLHVVDMGTSSVPNAPDKLYRNDGTALVDVSAAEKVAAGPDGLGDGAVWGDVDDDGDLDCVLLEGAGPAFYSAAGPTRYFRNEGQRGQSIRLDLSGRESGPVPVGARVTAVAGTLRVHRRVQANAWRGFQDPTRVHLGIGAATQADSVIVEWPAGSTQVWAPLPAGRWTLVEGTVTTGVPGSLPPAGAADLELSAPRPQPARGAQSMTVVAGRPGRVRVTVHDVAGRRVRTLHDGPVGPAGLEISWDGRDALGRAVAAGVWFVRAVDADGTVAVRRSVRLR